MNKQETYYQKDTNYSLKVGEENFCNGTEIIFPKLDLIIASSMIKIILFSPSPEVKLFEANHKEFMEMLTNKHSTHVKLLTFGQCPHWMMNTYLKERLRKI